MKITKEQFIQIVADKIGFTLDNGSGGGSGSSSAYRTKVVSPEALAKFLVEEGIVSTVDNTPLDKAIRE